MSYRGSLPKGSRVEVELQLGSAARGSALLAISFADNGGSTDTQSLIVAPQGSGRCGVQTGAAAGLLRVWVDFHDRDSGRLATYVDGRRHDAEAIEGDTTWAYSLS